MKAEGELPLVSSGHHAQVGGSTKVMIPQSTNMVFALTSRVGRGRYGSGTIGFLHL